MTSLFMSLNDYVIISVWMSMLVSILFAISIFSIDENPIIAGSSFILALFLTYGLFTFNPEKIPDYGTESQKAKMAHCFQQHTQSKNVGLETMTPDDIQRIMEKCWIQDHSDKNIKKD